MKIIRTIAAYFLRKEAAKRQVSYINSMSVSLFREEILPSYDPQQFIAWYARLLGFTPEQVVRADIVEVINVCKQTSTENTGDPAFAIRNADGSYFWVRIGDSIIHHSGEDAYLYQPAEKFRLRLKDKKSRNIVASCTYENGQILVQQTFDVMKMAQDDNEYSRTVPLEGKLIGCEFTHLLNFVNHL